LFAGGFTNSSAFLPRERELAFLALVCLRATSLCFSLPCDCNFLIRTIAEVPCNVVDLYNSATGAWSTAQLSVARDSLSATSIGSFAIFAGGAKTSALLGSVPKSFDVHRYDDGHSH
jgi:hypothetical protein